LPSCDPFVAERAVFHEDSVFPRVVYDDVSTLLGSSIPMVSLVSQCTVGVPVTVVPQNFAIPGSSVNFSSLLQRADVQPARSRTTLAHRTSRAPSRVSFPIATSSRSVHRRTCARRHKNSRAPVVVPSSTFCTSSTACSDPRLAGLFHPAATSGIPPSGVFPRVKPTDSSPAFTLMSLTANACRETTVAHNHSAPALTISPSGSCSSHGSVVRNWGFSPAHHSIPSWVFLLRASLRTRPG